MKKALIAGLLGCTLAGPAMAANMILNNVDAPGVGFNDPAPAVPVGGNGGTTVGAQRLIAYQRALELWGKTLRSDATVVVQGSFAGLPCTPTGGTLAQAGAIQIFADFPNAPLAGHWYGSALANAIAGGDLTPGPLDPGPLLPPFNDDIVANFNGNLGLPTCLAGSTWYYGLDSTPGPGQIDFLDTFMHEVAHGLGFQNFANETNGGTPLGLPDVYMANTLDLDTDRLWNTFTAAEIVASAIKSGRVVWAGPNVTANAPKVLGALEGIRLSGGVTKEIEFGPASFGPAPSVATFGGPVALATYGAGATDGCSPITSAVAGKVALVDRGTCAFVVKAKNAQIAGATAVMIANTVAGGSAAFSPGGSDPTITIATIGISFGDGAAIKAALPNVATEYFVDPSRLAGTTEGFVRLYAPGVVALGSSISHFDVTAVPNLLMEPFSTPDTRANRNLDLTPSLMQDIGWDIETLRIGSCDTGVPSVLATGQMLHANVDACAASAKNRGQFVSCMTGVANAAKKSGLLTGAQQGAIMSCAAALK